MPCIVVLQIVAEKVMRLYRNILDPVRLLGRVGVNEYLAAVIARPVLDISVFGTGFGDRGMILKKMSARSEYDVFFRQSVLSLCISEHLAARPANPIRSRAVVGTRRGVLLNLYQIVSFCRYRKRTFVNYFD